MTIHQNSEKLEVVAMETWKSRFADFEGLFGHERLGYSHQITLQLKWNEPTIFLAEPDWPHFAQFP